jgi:hypothetical protein
MSTHRRYGATSCRAMLLAALTGAAIGCAPMRIDAPTRAEVESATYEVGGQRFTLVAGRWQGAPFVAGSSSRPSAELVEDTFVTGDLNEDSRPEAVTVLWTQSGGTGTYYHLLVVARTLRGSVTQLGTAVLGDRVEVRSVDIDGVCIVVELVQADADDPMCCPTRLRRRVWALGTSGLSEVTAEVLCDPAVR